MKRLEWDDAGACRPAICPESSHGRDGVGIRRAEVHRRGVRVGMVAKDLRQIEGSTRCIRSCREGLKSTPRASSDSLKQKFR